MAVDALELLPEHVGGLFVDSDADLSSPLWAVCRAWAQAGERSLEELRLESSTSSTVDWQVQRLRRLRRLRRLDLRGARLEAPCLRRLLEAAPWITDVDVTLALPLPWPAYEKVLRRFAATRFQDALTLRPDARLGPLDVVTAQCYALHAQRIDVFCHFASAASQVRDARAFASPSRREILIGCDHWFVESLHVKGAVAFGIVSCTRNHLRRCFRWQLSQQGDGCWATNVVAEASWHDFLMMDIDE